MRKIFIAIVLTLLAASKAVPQAATATNSIEVILSLDGKTVPCSGLKVNLIVDGHPVHPQISGNRILVPKLIQQLYASKSSRYKNNLDIRVTCSGLTFRFPHQYPVAALPGSWEVGIATPPQWFQNFRRTGQIEAAMWLTTLDYACYDCDPGIIVSVTHPDPPSNTVARLQNEQRNGIGETARDDAYALAVYKVDYDRNSLYLLHLLQ